MSVKLGLLALLADEPAHGYQLKTDFERRTGGSWALNIGQVYTTLQRLERARLVERADEDEERRAYRITVAGRAELEQWFTNPVVLEEPSRDELTIKVLLAVAARNVDVADIVQRQRAATVSQLQAYTQRKARADPERDLAWLMLLDALIFKAEAEVRWLDACEARIREWRRRQQRPAK